MSITGSLSLKATVTFVLLTENLKLNSHNTLNILLGLICTSSSLSARITVASAEVYLNYSPLSSNQSQELNVK